jgi:hypothetical protein
MNRNVFVLHDKVNAILLIHSVCKDCYTVTEVNVFEIDSIQVGALTKY